MSCADELRGLGDVRETIKAKGGDIIAICVQTPERIKEGREDNPNLPVILACDPNAEAIRKLSLVHAQFGKVGKTLSIPANILMDAKGVVQWVHYAETVSDRPDPKAVLKKVLTVGSNAALFGTPQPT
jgi:peroxiredoxin